jgi:hypothetical protein
MLPTFEVLGEWLLVSKLHRFGRNITIGDVVAYSIPINDEVGVKRVLGLEGDYVLMDAPDGDGSEGGTCRGSMIQVCAQGASAPVFCEDACVYLRLGAERALLDCRGQSGSVARLEVFWACAAGVDPGQGRCDGPAVFRVQVDYQSLAEGRAADGDVISHVTVSAMSGPVQHVQQIMTQSKGQDRDSKYKS